MASYADQSKRVLGERMDEHKKSKPESVEFEHQNAFDTKHEFDVENTQILDREPAYFKKSLSEMIHINSLKNTINNKKDLIETLEHTYKVFLNRFSK